MRKNRIRNIILAVIVLAAAIALILLPKLLSKPEAETDDGASILKAQVELGSVRTTISGAGTLTDREGDSITVPGGVELLEYYVSDGDHVTAGQPIAAVDPLSVMTTIATIQENLDYLSKQMQKNSVTTGFQTIYALSAGRVKAVYASVGDDVSDVMAKHGALAVVSMDGMMAARMDTEEPIEPGSPVTIGLPDGSTVNGKIEQRQGNRITAIFSDEAARIGDRVTVTSPDGRWLGEGDAYVHSSWNVTAGSGKVTYVAAKADAIVWQGAYLFSLDEVDNTAAFKDFSEQHRAYEDAMERLFELYEHGLVTAESDGIVKGIDKNKVGLMRQNAGGFRLFLLAGGDPNSAVPSQYVTRYAAVASVSFSKIVFSVQKEGGTVNDWTEYPKVEMSKTETKIMTDFSGVILYSWDKSAGAWVEITPDDLFPGDVLYFVYDKDGNLLWILRPPVPKKSGGGGGGGGGYEEPFEMFELRETEIATVIPPDAMTVEISIDELDILAVAVGQSAEVALDAVPGRSFEGTVEKLDRNGTSSGGNTRYTVTIAIPRDENMLAGMNATAILTVGETDGILTLPVAAISQKGNHAIVYTGCDEANGQLTDPVEITVGVSDGKTVQVVDGLSEGDTVWYLYYEPSSVPSLFAGLAGEDL